MTDTERQRAIDALRARRAARGMDDPLNRLIAHTERAIAEGKAPVAAVDRQPSEH